MLLFMYPSVYVVCMCVVFFGGYIDFVRLGWCLVEVVSFSIVCVCSGLE